MKKNLLLIALCILPIVSGCGSNGNNETSSNIPVSSLRGTFIYKDSITTQLMKTFRDGDYLYSTTYPQTLMREEQQILYRIDQSLKLNRDYTYNYRYTIILGNPGDWGNLEFANLSVNISGTFTFKEMTNKVDESYIVSLSNPTSGTEEIYGTNFNNPADIYSWTRHSQVDYVLNIEQVLDVDPSYQFDQYVKGREVIVTKAKDDTESNVVSDDVFYPFILDDIGDYFTY